MNTTPDLFIETIEKSKQELLGLVGNYQFLLDQLAQIEQAIQDGSLDAHRLADLEKSFYRYPRLAVVRAAAPTDDGLDETRQLLVELRNKIIILKREESAK